MSHALRKLQGYQSNLRKWSPAWIWASLWEVESRHPLALCGFRGALEAQGCPSWVSPRSGWAVPSPPGLILFFLDISQTLRKLQWHQSNLRGWSPAQIWASLWEVESGRPLAFRGFQGAHSAQGCPSWVLPGFGLAVFPPRLFPLDPLGPPPWSRYFFSARHVVSPCPGAPGMGHLTRIWEAVCNLRVPVTLCPRARLGPRDPSKGCLRDLQCSGGQGKVTRIPRRDASVTCRFLHTETARNE